MGEFCRKPKFCRNFAVVIGPLGGAMDSFVTRRSFCGVVGILAVYGPFAGVPACGNRTPFDSVRQNSGTGCAVPPSNGDINIARTCIDVVSRAVGMELAGAGSYLNPAIRQRWSPPLKRRQNWC